ncbi:MAG: hypothetical protein FJX76_24650 [Armatimonadetes bacterium]|nr:hypothetical protein [Armatimonadota bacterium]
MEQHVDLAFVATVTHDLKSPLAAIMGYADLLADPIYGDICEDKVGYARKIRRVGQLMLMQINNLVMVCRLEKGDPGWLSEDISMATLFAELEDTFAFMARQGEVDLTFATPADLRVRGDRARIALLMQNLLNNAVRHTSPDGVIRVAATLENNRAVVEVFNSGSFIPESERDKLFQKFGHIKGSNDGAGLGLFVARGIVEGHHGHIALDSTREHGTTVRFAIPALPTRPTAAPSPARGCLRVLLVGAAGALGTDLEDAGCQVLRADGALEALQEAPRAKPDAVISFESLPDLSFDDFRYALGMDPSTAQLPVVVITATSSNPPDGIGAVPVSTDAAAVLAAVHTAIASAAAPRPAGG